MLRWVRFFLLIGLFAGLGIRASGAHVDVCSSKAAHEKAEGGHDDKCPPTPHEHEHQHGECCHVPMWLPPFGDAPGLFLFETGTGHGLAGNESPPEDPVLAFEKPPLI